MPYYHIYHGLPSTATMKHILNCFDLYECCCYDSAMMMMTVMIMVMMKMTLMMKPLGPSLVWNCLPSHGMHHGRRREGRETSVERTPMDGSSSRGVPGRPADRRSRSPAGRAVQPRGPPPPQPVRADPGPPTWTEPDSPVPSSVYAESGEEESVDSQGSSFSMVLEGDDLEQAKAFVSSLYRNMQLELFPTDSTRRLAGKMAWYQRHTASMDWQAFTDVVPRFLRGSWLVQWENWRFSHARGRRAPGAPRE